MKNRYEYIGKALFLWWLLGILSGVFFMFLDKETNTLGKNIVDGIDYLFFYVFYKYGLPCFFSIVEKIKNIK